LGLREDPRKRPTKSHRHLTQEIKKKVVAVFLATTGQLNNVEVCTDGALLKVIA
jgi:hypothetical protein